MAQRQFILRVGGQPAARVGVGVADWGMRGDGASMPLGQRVLAPGGSYKLVPFLSLNTMHAVIAVCVVMHGSWCKGQR